MRYICGHFMKSYMNISPEILDMFCSTVPNFELLCDQMEDFFLNKYYRSEKLGKRLYFKEETIQELRYYLKMERERAGRELKEKGEEEMAETADSETFSVAK